MTVRRTSVRAGRITLGIALALAGLYLLYLCVANVIIRTRLLRSWINDGSSSTHVEYESASTFWPGRAHVTGLRIWDRDRAVEWRIALDEGVAWIGLLDLLGHRFHTSSIRGTGLVLRIRTRVPTAQADARWLSVVPDLPELPGPPVRDPAEDAPPETPSGAWTVRLDGVGVDDVREIWVDAYHFTGRSRLTGGLHLVPRRTLEIPRTVLVVEDGALEYFGLLGAASLRGQVEAAIQECDLRPIEGGDVLKFMTGMGHVEGRIDGVQVLDEIVGLAPHVRFRKGRGTARAELSLEQGRGTGYLEFGIDGLEAVTDGMVLDGRAEGIWRLAALDLHEGWADFSGSRLRLPGVVVSRGGGKSRPWWMTLDIGEGRLSTDLPRVFRARMSANARDARPLYRILNTGLPHWAEGMLELESMSAHADVALGPTFVEVKALQAEGADYHVQGRYRRNSKDVDGLFLVSRGSLDLAAAISSAGTELKLFRAEKWYGERAAAFRSAGARAAAK